MKERFCWNCRFEKGCQSNGLITDQDQFICGRHRFVGERTKKTNELKKTKLSTKKKDLTKQTKLAIIWNNIRREIKKIRDGVQNG